MTTNLKDQEAYFLQAGSYWNENGENRIYFNREVILRHVKNSGFIRGNIAISENAILYYDLTKKRFIYSGMSDNVYGAAVAGLCKFKLKPEKRKKSKGRKRNRP